MKSRDLTLVRLESKTKIQIQNDTRKGGQIEGTVSEDTVFRKAQEEVAKWQYQSVKYPRLAEIPEDPTTPSWKLSVFASVLTPSATR